MLHHTRGRGRPSNGPYCRTIDHEPELSLLARTMRADFESLSPAGQAEARARALLILADQDQQRTRPSPLARIAGYVYGIALDWMPAEYKVESE